MTDFIEEVRAHSDLVRIAAQTCEIRNEQARTIKCKCPFHADNGPSMVIWPDQQRWHCFGSCAEGGDVFAWIMKRDNVDFWTAATTLAKDAGVPVPEFKAAEPDKKAARDQAQALLHMAATFYHKTLLQNQAADEYRNYLKARGFGIEQSRRWMLGAALPGNELLALFTREKVDLELAVTLGLLGKDDDTGRLYDHFSSRVVIPFVDAGRIAYMTGRTILPDREPKYLHLKNSKYATKTPFNWRGRGKDAVVVEGPFDVIAVEEMADSGLSAIGLMGLGTNNPLLIKGLERREQVFVALDADKAGQANITKVAALVGGDKARLLTWPEGVKDAAEWFQKGISPGDFERVLAGSPAWVDHVISQIGVRSDKDKAVEAAVVAVAGIKSAALLDVKSAELKKAAKAGGIAAKTVTHLLRSARRPRDRPPGEEESNYRVIDGELVCAGDEMAHITTGGVPRFSQMVTVDDGEETELQLTLEVQLKNGPLLEARIPAEDSGEAAKMVAHIRKIAGPRLTVTAGQRLVLTQAMDAISKDLEQMTEIARTGWIEMEAGLSYCTPGGVIGKLPDDYTVKLPKDFDRYSVADGSDEDFNKALSGIIGGFLPAFDPIITYPALAFAILPPAAKFIGYQKFAMHFSGETGSLKTETAKLLMSFYGGKFAESSPLISWRSTVNSIEHMGFWLPDVLGLVDDFKPIISKTWEFVDLIQRYADGNDRSRLSRDIKMQRRSAMRWWFISTGEDIPPGESSVLARMIMIRFARRPAGAAYNENLAKAQRSAKYWPIVTARWVKWLMDHKDALGFEAEVALRHQLVAEHLQKVSPEMPNVNRVSRNLAVLWAVWREWWRFVAGSVKKADASAKAEEWIGQFGNVVFQLAESVAHHVVNEKPSRQFLDALNEGLDSGRFFLMGRLDRKEPLRSGLAGWWDRDGIYILPAMYNEVARWLRESGQAVGFSKGELTRLLKEEGLLARVDKESASVVVMVGGIQPRRVLHFKPGSINVPSPAPADEPE